MRFKDDKHDGNFIDIGDKIINSIKDGVIQEQVGSARHHFTVAGRDS